MKMETADMKMALEKKFLDCSCVLKEVCLSSAGDCLGWQRSALFAAPHHPCCLEESSFEYNCSGPVS